MNNLLQKGLMWASRKLQMYASDTVTYMSADIVRVVPAVMGRTEHECISDYDIRTGAFLNDFLIRFADLGFYPVPGDRITTADRRQYEVLELGLEGCWRWSDPYGILMRVHTKEIEG